MKIDEQIVLRLKALSGASSIVFPAIVNEVDRDTFTCTVTPIDDVEMYRVRLKAGVESISDGLVEIPAVGSSVLVVLIGNNDEQAFIAKCSLVEEVLFFGGDNGGLIKINELVTELEKVNSAIETIKSALTSATMATSDNGLSFRTKMMTDLAPVQTADYSNIENPKVKH